MANVRAESSGIACAAFCVIALIGFFVIACTVSFLVFCSGLFSFAITRVGSFGITSAGFFAIAGAGSFGIARTVSFLVPCSGLVRCNSEGASACACAAALEMTRSDIVANARQAGRDMEARYAGNYDVRQAFLFSLFCRKAMGDPRTRRIKP